MIRLGDRVRVKHIERDGEVCATIADAVFVRFDGERRAYHRKDVTKLVDLDKLRSVSVTWNPDDLRKHPHGF